VALLKLSAARAAELAVIGITPVVYDVTSDPNSPPSETLRELPPFDTVFWAVGFDRTSGTTHRDVHVAGLARLLDALQGSPRVILSSSTGVWGDEGGGVVTEETPTNPSREAGHVLVEAESLMRHHLKGPGVALRFAGLYGPDRLPRLDDLRAWPLRRYPYLVFYVERQDLLDVWRVLHAQRDIPAWMQKPDGS
jgi:nucleoside-diphosphate-sugar epimerase